MRVACLYPDIHDNLYLPSIQPFCHYMVLNILCIYPCSNLHSSAAICTHVDYSMENVIKLSLLPIIDKKSVQIQVRFFCQICVLPVSCHVSFFFQVLWCPFMNIFLVWLSPSWGLLLKVQCTLRTWHVLLRV